MLDWPLSRVDSTRFLDKEKFSLESVHWISIISAGTKGTIGKTVIENSVKLLRIYLNCMPHLNNATSEIMWVSLTHYQMQMILSYIRHVEIRFLEMESCVLYKVLHSVFRFHHYLTDPGSKGHSFFFFLLVNHVNHTAMCICVSVSCHTSLLCSCPVTPLLAYRWEGYKHSRKIYVSARWLAIK